MECALLIVKCCERSLAHMVDSTAIELALINLFIVILIVLDGIIKIESTKSNYFDPT
jgi:hypothetical protein